jgi:hypothetical protein
MRTCVQKMGSIRDRSGVDLGSDGIILEVDLMGYKNFEVPDDVDNEI